jgi:hypothetical protein
MARDDRVVDPAHSQGDRPAALNVGLFEQKHRTVGQRLFRFDRSSATGRPAADHEDVYIEIWLEVFHRFSRHQVLNAVLSRCD